MRSILIDIPIPRWSKWLYTKWKIEKWFEAEVFTFLRKQDYLCYQHPIYTSYVWLGSWDILSLGSWDILSLRTGRILSPWNNWSGYKIVFLYPWRKRVYVHRFILECFYWISDLECNHKNSNRSDNSLHNLEYCTRKDNMIHASGTWNYVTSFHTNHPDKWKFWYSNPKSKEVHRYDLLTRKYIDSFWSALEAKRNTGINNSDIWQCCMWKLKYAGWFIWSRNLYEIYPTRNTD